MAREPERPGETELEAALRDLGRSLAYPPTPDVSERIRARLVAYEAPPAPHQLRRGLRWRLLAVAALLLLLLGAALVATPGARHALAGRLGLRGIRLVVQTPTAVPASPAPATASPAGGGPSSLAPSSSSSPAPTPSPATATAPALPTGARLPLDQAQRAVSFPILVPAALGPPDAVYVSSYPISGQVTLAYQRAPGATPAPADQPSVLLFEFRAQVDAEVFEKVLYSNPPTTVEQVTVNGQTGYWLAGQPHQLYYRDPQGDILADSVRLVGNVLIWEQGDVTYRLEGVQSQEDALRIAASLR